MKLRKSKVSMAVAATLGLACLAPSASFGSQEKYSVDTAAGTLATDSRGDTLLYPFYTVANGAVTNFSLTNTSATQVVVAVIRFREQLHSVDVFDMHVILSPRDKFDFWVADDGQNGRPVVHWDDNSCVVGPESGARSAEFREAWQPFVETDAQMRVGHMEVLGVVDISQTALGNYGVHQSGVPRNCRALASVFSSPARVSVLNENCSFEPGTLTDGDVMRVDNGTCITYPIVGGFLAPTPAPGRSGYGYLRDVDNVLMGRYIVTIPGQGMEAGGDAIAIRDTNMANPENTGQGTARRWHATAHSPARCDSLNPSNCRTTDLYSWDTQEWSHPHLGEMFFLDGFQRALGAQVVAGDWSNNPGNRVNVDWVLSFPSKYAYLDYVQGALTIFQIVDGQVLITQAELDKWVLLNHPKAQDYRNDAWPNSDGVWTRATSAANGYAPGFTYNTNIGSIFSVYGTEENSTGGVSPGDPPLAIPNETNVFTLLNTAISEEPLPSVIQVNGGDELSRRIVPFNLTNTPRGWARMNLYWPGARAIDYDLNGIPGITCTGLGNNQFGIDNDDAGNQCEDLYFTGNGTPVGQFVSGTTIPGTMRPYRNGDSLDIIPDAVNCNWSPEYCTPPSDAVTGLIFTTRATSDPTQNDATLTELQKFSN